MTASYGRTMMLTTVSALLSAILVPYTPAQTAILPRTMPQMGEVDPRFVSFNIEAVEVAGGRFWRPFKDESAPTKPTAPDAKGDRTASVPGGSDPYEYRPPIDLQIRSCATLLLPWRRLTCA